MDTRKLGRLLAVAVLGVALGAACGDDDDDDDRRGNVVQEFCTKLMEECGGGVTGGTTAECVTETNACLAGFSAEQRAGWEREMRECVPLACFEMIECWGNTTIEDC